MASNHSHHHVTMRSTTAAEWNELRSIGTQSWVELTTDSMVGIVTDALSIYTNDTNSTWLVTGTAPPPSLPQSTNTEEVSYKGYQYRPETYIVPIIFGIIFLAGLMGNGMLIAVFIKHRAMRNVPNT